MLSKKHRLTKREDFSIIYSKGSYVERDGFAIKYLQTGQSVTRIGFSVGKNFSKRAVRRNRARRILQETCRIYMQLLKPGFDIIVILRPGHEDIEFAKAKDVLKQIFLKANLFI